MDREVERVIARLEARFDAALAREEEEAAADLAVSLRQDRTLAEVIRSGVSLRLMGPEGASAPVAVVGADYCGTGTPLTCLRRLGSTPLLSDDHGGAPEMRGDSLQEVARRWSRCGRTVELGGQGGLLRGRLAQVGPDNVVLDNAAGRVIVPLRLVDSIRLVHAG